jgi:glutamyl-tRNA synthetase
MTPQSLVRVRFAPSPTGHLHIGSLRTALFNWFFARSMGGKYLVRIEDTDVARSKKEYVDSIMSSLEWSGLMPDESIVFQMSRLEEHKKAIEQLLESGKAYRCFCAPSNTDLVQEQLEAGIGSKYPGTCRNLSPSKNDLQKPHAIRFKLEKKEEKFQFIDLIRGPLAFDYDQFDDFVIVRQDGIPTYNFVVVVDDIFMKISHVIRGEDHIYNTPKQIFLYQALNAQLPSFAHLPLILSPNGGRLSKRDGAVSVVDYKRQGFLPDALCNYLVRLGWSYKDQEIFTRDEIISLFKLENIGKSGAVFDHKKLEWVNNIYLKQKDAKTLLDLCTELSPDFKKTLSAFWSENQIDEVINLYKERSNTLLELINQLVELTRDPVIDLAALDPAHHSSTTKALLSLFLTKSTELTSWTQEELTTAGKAALTESGLKMPALGIPLRIALTGSSTSPGIFHLMNLLPKELVLKRLSAFIALCKD